MRGTTVLAATAVVFLLSLGEGIAQEEPLDLGEVVVTATKTERAIEDIAASVTLIKKQDIEKTTARYVDDILRNEAGIEVDRGKGGLSSPSTHIRLRGFSHGRAVAVMRDGVPVNRAVCGGAKWSELPVSIVDKVEIVRGASSSLYGSGAMGGVINIFTKEPTEELEISLDSAYGTHNTWEEGLSITGQAPDYIALALEDRLGYVLSYNRLETNGYVAYDGRDTSASTTKKKNAAINNYRQAETLFAKLVYTIDPSSSLSLSHSYWDDEYGMGRIYNHKDFVRNRTILGYKRKGETFDITANLFYLDEDFVDYADNASWPSGANPFAQLAQVRNRPGKDAGANLTLSTPFTENQIWTVGMDYRWVKMKDELKTYGPASKAGDELAEGKQQRASIFFEDEINFDKLVLNLSARGDWYKTYDGYHYKKIPASTTETSYSSKNSGAFNPKIGAVYHLSEATTLRGSIGRAFHMPYLYSLYATTECPPGKLNVGNPDLKPEYVIAYELGVDQKVGEQLSLRLTGFYNDIKDWMDASYWRTAAGSKQYKWSNIDEAENAGVEFEAEYRPFEFEPLSLFANYTYLHTEIDKYAGPPGAALGSPYTSDDYKGNRLTDQARHKANLGFTFTDPELLTLTLRGRYVGSRFDDLENTKKLEHYLTADLLISRKITEFLELVLEVNDLFNESWSEDYDWLASSGRTFMGRLKLTF